MEIREIHLEIAAGSKDNLMNSQVGDRLVFQSPDGEIETPELLQEHLVIIKECVNIIVLPFFNPDRLYRLYVLTFAPPVRKSGHEFKFPLPRNEEEWLTFLADQRAEADTEKKQEIQYELSVLLAKEIWLLLLLRMLTVR